MGEDVDVGACVGNSISGKHMPNQTRHRSQSRINTDRTIARSRKLPPSAASGVDSSPIGPLHIGIVRHTAHPDKQGPRACSRSLLTRYRERRVRLEEDGKSNTADPRIWVPVLAASAWDERSRRSAVNESKVQHCSDDRSMPEMAVETGKVSRLEQLRPEQGARRPGAAGPSGDRLPSCSPDDDPETISQSSPLRSEICRNAS